MLTIRNMLLALLLGVCMALAAVWFVESADAFPPKLITCKASVHPPRPRFFPATGVLSMDVLVICSKPVRTSKVFFTLLVIGRGWPRSEWSYDPRATVALQTYPWRQEFHLHVVHQCRRPEGQVLYKWWGTGYVEWWNGQYTQSGYLKSKGIWIPCA